jgi:arylsulfatase A-like enzyme
MLRFLKPVLVFLIITSCEPAKENVDSQKQEPNILLILADDQRFNTIHALGNNEIITPNLDRLAAMGTSFNNAYIMGGNSGAVCMPSRAMLLSGRHLFGIEGQGREIPEDHILLGEYLQANGYATFGTGKWHNGKTAYARSFSHGDAIFFGGMSDHWNVPLFHFDSTGEYKPAIPYIDDPFSSKEVQYHNADHFRHGEHSTDIFTGAVLEFISQQKHVTPFFAYLSLTAPHDPRSLPERYLQMYDTANISLPKNFIPEHPFDNGELVIRDEKLAAAPRTPSETKLHIRDYYAMITHLDEKIGEILDLLEEQNELTNTIVIFTGDNGLAVGQHGLMGKQNLYEHSIKVPLLMAGPNIPAGESRDQMVYLWDIYPSLAEMLEQEIPASVQGKSFYGAFNNPDYEHRKEMLYAYRHLQRAVRKNDFKLIEYQVDGKRTTQLFNLQQDPLEMNNLYQDAGYTDEIEELRTIFKQQQILLGDSIQML